MPRVHAIVLQNCSGISPYIACHPKYQYHEEENEVASIGADGSSAMYGMTMGSKREVHVPALGSPIRSSLCGHILPPRTLHAVGSEDAGIYSSILQKRAQNYRPCLSISVP